MTKPEPDNNAADCTLWRAEPDNNAADGTLMAHRKK
jgi:hypothetical protein